MLRYEYLSKRLCYAKILLSAYNLIKQKNISVENIKRYNEGRGENGDSYQIVNI